MAVSIQLTDEERVQMARFASRKLQILSSAEDRTKALRADEKFQRAPWRRKVKILVKETERIYAKFGVLSWYTMFKNNTPREPFEKEMELRKCVANTFLRLIGAQTVDDDGTFAWLLRTGVTNKQGSSISRIARKKRSTYIIEDILCLNRMNWKTRKDRKLKITQLPLTIQGCHVCSRWSFWEGHDYAEWIQEQDENRN